MKKIIILFSAFCLLIAFSCQKERPQRFRFSSPIEENSSGLTIMAIGYGNDSIHLEGYISVQEGEVELILTNPDGVLVFTKHIESGEYFQLNEIFESIPGFWKLKYLSKNGTGSIDLNVQG